LGGNSTSADGAMHAQLRWSSELLVWVLLPPELH